MNHPFYEEDRVFSKFEAWTHLVMMANHADNKVLIDGKMVVVERGSFITSVRKLQERWKWSNTKAIAFLDLLESEQMIVKKSDTKKTVITLTTYDIYQGEDEEKRHENDTETTQKRTNKNEKNYKNDKNLKKEDLKDSPQFDEFWNMYPRRVGNADALTAWNNAIKRNADPNEIYKAVANYKINIQQSETETKYIKHPASFLNKDRWKDYLKLTVLNGGGNGAKHGGRNAGGYAGNAGTYNPDEDELNDLYYGSPKPGA